MKESKEKQTNNSNIKKINKNDDEQVSGGSMERCPVCYILISDDNMDAHLKGVHGFK